MVKYLSENLHWFSVLHEQLKLIPHVHKPFCWYSCWLLYASTGKYEQVCSHVFCEQSCTDTWHQWTDIHLCLPRIYLAFSSVYRWTTRNYPLTVLVHLLYCILFGWILHFSISFNISNRIPHLPSPLFLIFVFFIILPLSSIPVSHDSYHFHYIASFVNSEKSVKNGCKWDVIEEHLRFILAICVILKR